MSHDIWLFAGYMVASAVGQRSSVEVRGLILSLVV